MTHPPGPETGSPPSLARSHLASLEEDPDRKPLIKREALCSTLAGNCCDLLTVTSPTTSLDALKKRKGVIISGERGMGVGLGEALARLDIRLPLPHLPHTFHTSPRTSQAACTRGRPTPLG